MQVTFSVPRGEIVALMGPSGSGKTTVLRLIAGLEPFQSGSVQIEDLAMFGNGGTPASTVRALRRKIGMVFQFHHLLPEFDAMENAEMPMRIARMPLGEARARATELLRRVGLGERLAHRPSMLSGGDRVAIEPSRSETPSAARSAPTTGGGYTRPCCAA